VLISLEFVVVLGANWMDPVCLYIFGKPIYWYGIMVALGFLACVVHLTILGIREGRSPAFGSDLAFWVMLSGMLGARITYVVMNIGYYLDDPWAMLRVDQGGLIYYGGFAFAFIAGIIFARIHQINFLALCDYGISALPLGHAFGRLGCLFNGCCYGAISALPWSIFQQGARRHPVQLYEVIANLGIYAFLVFAYRRRKRDGEILALYCLAYPFVRFMIEFLRGDERLAWYGISVGQVVSLLIFAVGLVLWFALPRRLSRLQ